MPFRLLIILILLVSFSCNNAEEKSNDSPPNVIFILADDLGYGDLGFLGQSYIETPNLDRLAREGMFFTNHYSGAPVCAPSRSALITGLHTGHTPVRGNFEVQPEGQYPMPDTLQTLSKIFQQAGYATGAFGKWGLGFVGTSLASGAWDLSVHLGIPVIRDLISFMGTTVSVMHIATIPLTSGKIR
ncbi:MAG: sulfatase-like hydrolase/transferase [Algoriphagus sp.]|nr:sulfatase-like hydrolase/transferase [Algoriphagus sp.]